MKELLLVCILMSIASASSVKISVVKPHISSDTITLEAQGVVAAQNSVVITAKSSGIFTAFVANDTQVHKNQKIAQIRDGVRQKKLALLKKKLHYMQRALQTQKVKAENAKEMYMMGVASKNSYLKEKIALEHAKELYETIANEYDTLALEEKNAQIVAPADGFVTKLLPQNSYVAYQTQLATLLTKKIMVKLFVDASYAQAIHKGMRVALLSTYANMQGRVVSIMNRSVHNLIQVNVQPEAFMPLSLQVKAKIILKNIRGLKIPKEAIVLVNNQPAVYVIKENVAHLVFVQIQKDMIQSVLITNTFSEGTQIAYKNAYLLHDNLEVSVE